MRLLFAGFLISSFLTGLLGFAMTGPARASFINWVACASVFAFWFYLPAALLMLFNGGES